MIADLEVDGCDSCQKRPATTVETFGDDASFAVCWDCSQLVGAEDRIDLRPKELVLT